MRIRLRPCGYGHYFTHPRRDLVQTQDVYSSKQLVQWYRPSIRLCLISRWIRHSTCLRFAQKATFPSRIKYQAQKQTDRGPKKMDGKVEEDKLTSNESVYTEKSCGNRVKIDPNKRSRERNEIYELSRR